MIDKELDKRLKEIEDSLQKSISNKGHFFIILALVALLIKNCS